MHTIMGKLQAAEGKLEELIESFNVLRQFDGFKDYKIFKNKEEANQLFFIEMWDSKESRQKFMDSMPKDKMEEWMTLLAGKPEMKEVEEV